MSDYEHDAIPSWFGYVYQGKIALYYALTVINEKLDKGGSFKDYSLEVEWMEDFSIKKGDEYQSIHQVKAYRNSTPGRYKSAIEGIIQKLNEFPNAEGYLHTLKEIKYNPTRGNITDFEQLKRDFNTKSYPADVLSRLYHCSYSSKSNAFELKIDKLIIDAIKRHYDKKKYSNITVTGNQCEGVKFHLFKMLDLHIDERYRKYGNLNKNGTKDTIKFKKIINLFKFNYEKSSRTYVQLELKKKIETHFEEFCADPNLCTSKTCEVCSLKRIIDKLNKLPPREVWRLIEKASPQKQADRTDLSSLYDEAGMMDSLFSCFYSIDFDEYEVGYPKEIKYESKDGEVMLPTTITGERRSNTIAKKILENRNNRNLENLFEIPCWISSDVTIDNIYDTAMNTRDLRREDLSKEDLLKEALPKKENITKPNVKVSRLDKVIGEFPC